jgi:hypothetical protein
MENDTNSHELTDKPDRWSFVKSSGFWSAIAGVAATISAIAAVFAVMQAKELSELQLYAGRPQFTLQEIYLERIDKQNVFVAKVKLQNVGGRPAEGFSWAFSKHGTGKISVLDVWKNAIQDPVAANQNLNLDLSEASFSGSEKQVYLPFAISYVDRALNQEFRQYFYPKIQWNPLKGSWEVVHATAKETVSNADLIGEKLNEGIERARKLQ